MLAIAGVGMADYAQYGKANPATLQPQATQPPQTQSSSSEISSAKLSQSKTVCFKKSDGDSDDEEDEDTDGNDDIVCERTSVSSTAAPGAAVSGAKNSTAPAQPANSGGYTLAQVAQHNSAGSCWSAINGSVYDLTSFIAYHPGGEAAIISLCGKNGSAAFDAQHGGQSRPASELASLKIGALVQ